MQYKVAVLGLGAIFSRHLSAIKANPNNYQLCSYYDPDYKAVATWSHKLKEARAYLAEEEAYLDKTTNCVVILSPSHYHYLQTKKALLSGKNVIVEKPAAFSASELEELELLAKTQGLKVFCILQVRLNPSVGLLKIVLNKQLLGNIRGVSLIQRWQRPEGYFQSWRSSQELCGGILNEFAIHYLDILQYLLGVPKVIAASSYKTKFIQANLADTIYGLFDFGDFGGNFEISLSAEPKNIEISLIIMGAKGFIKLGGKSLDQVVDFGFINAELTNQYQKCYQDFFEVEFENQANSGACPHHPELYRQIITSPSLFELNITKPVVTLINNIYKSII